MSGTFRQKPRTREFICDLLEPEEGSDPLTVSLVTSLTFAQIDELGAVLKRSVNGGITYWEIFEAIAPFVAGWNHVAYDHASGEEQPVPPPREAGPDALKTIDSDFAIWALVTLANIHRGGDKAGADAREKKETASASSPAPSGDATSTLPPPTGKTRRGSRRGSTSPASSPTT